MIPEWYHIWVVSKFNFKGGMQKIQVQVRNKMQKQRPNLQLLLCWSQYSKESILLGSMHFSMEKRKRYFSIASNSVLSSGRTHFPELFVCYKRITHTRVDQNYCIVVFYPLNIPSINVTFLAFKMSTLQTMHCFWCWLKI